MAAEVVKQLMPNDRIYEECKQLVKKIRRQLGDPNEFVNYFGFVRGSSALGLVERQLTWCDEENAYYRHTANFALVLKESIFAIEPEPPLLVPETRSPIFSFDRCTRRWQVVAKFIPGDEDEAIQDEIYIRLQCLDVQNGSPIRADIRTDLYRGTESIDDVTPTNVYFGAMDSSHVIFTGTRDTKPADYNVTPDGYADTLYTLLGSLCFKNCCDD